MAHTVVCQEWLETERGWGQRPDGASLHMTNQDRDTYIKEYWDTMPDDVPDEYSRPAGSPALIEVDDDTYDKVKQSKNGIRLWSDAYRQLKK